MASGALAPYRVIDLTGEQGWLCGRLLADLGADVRKVEPPGGDPGRRRGPFDHRRPDDPDANLGWWFANQHKRSIVVDVERPEGRQALLELLDGADALLESQPTGWLDRHGLGPDVLLQRNPRLVVTSISPFGRTGPYAGYLGPDLVVSAMCGLQWLTGDPDRPPVRISVPQLYRHASVEAAAHTVIALHHATRSGHGQHVDVSAQLAGIRTLMNAQAFHLLEHRELTRQGVYSGYSHNRYRMVLPCLDGHVTVLPIGGQLGGPMMRRLFEWAAQSGVAVDADLAATDFASLDFSSKDNAFFDAVTDVLADLFARHTKATIYARALDELLLVAPLSTVADLRADAQLAARGYFHAVDHDDGPVTFAGPWARFGRTPLRAPSPAPRVGQHQAERSWPDRPGEPALHGSTGLAAHQTDGYLAAGPEPELPFSGLRVLDLSWVGVGPMAAGYLAAYGATVIKVESSVRPDVLRLTPPFRDGRPGLNNGHFFANMNASKLGLGIDMARPEGRAVVWRIIETWADVVLESFTPRTLRGWGMDWSAIERRRPDLVMLSTCMQGQTGPRANYRGFGNLMAALSGYYHVTGHSDGGPVMIYGAYTDFICQRFAATALAAAVDHRQRSGEGQHIDLSQLEAATQFLGPELLDWDRNGLVAGRHGNRDPSCCPHVVLPCRPDPSGREGWLALACETDEQWASLVERLGRPAWALDPALATCTGRKAREDALEAELARWSRQHDATELFQRLQPHVPCGPVHSVPALHDDPQVRHRGYFTPLTHTVMGEVPYDGLAAELSRTPGRYTEAGPCLGEDSWAVLTELIGMNADEVAALVAEGTVEITG